MAATEGDNITHGDVETATRAAVQSLGDLNDLQGALAATAIRLARELDADEPAAGMPGLARELRETLIEMKEARDADEAASELEDYLSSPVGDGAPDR